MQIDLNSYQAELLRDMAIEERDSVKCGSTVYGDNDLQGYVVEELQDVIDKLSKLI